MIIRGRSRTLSRKCFSGEVIFELITRSMRKGQRKDILARESSMSQDCRKEGGTFRLQQVTGRKSLKGFQPRYYTPAHLCYSKLVLGECVED